MTGNNRTYIIIAAAVVVFILLLGWWLLYKKAGVSPQGYSGTLGGAAGTPVVSSSIGFFNRQAAPAGVSAPDASSSGVPANVAKPNLVGPAGPNTPANFRSFAISANKNQFTPSTVIVNVGDTVHILITSVDNNYDFTQPDYGFNYSIPKGQTKTIEFQATAGGKFTFYCKACGGPAKGPVGYIIVVSK